MNIYFIHGILIETGNKTMLHIKCFCRHYYLDTLVVFLNLHGINCDRDELMCEVPAYQFYSCPRDGMRSAKDTLRLNVPLSKLQTFRHKAFSVTGPRIWKDLSSSIVLQWEIYLWTIVYFALSTQNLALPNVFKTLLYIVDQHSEHVFLVIPLRFVNFVK